MAIYTYRCPRCDSRKEVVQSIKSYCEKPEIPVCDCLTCEQDRLAFERGEPVVDVLWSTPMERYLTAPLVSFDTAPWAAYKSPIDGSVIDSRAKRNEHMAKHGVVMFDDIKPDIERNRKIIQQAATADLKDDIATALHRVEAGHKPDVVHDVIPA